MICSQVTVDDGTTKNYDCINGVCTETLGGQYTEPTCAGACKPSGDNTSLYILAAVGVGLAYLLFGRSK